MKMRLFTKTRVTIALLLMASLAHADQTGPATSAGPGRIVCKGGTMCELGIGTPATLKFQINVEALTAEDKDRLSKQCNPGGKTPCIVTVEGTEMSDPMKVKAAKIKWYN
jgi:hypothetical protein